MTIREKIFELNRQFQISYYDIRIDFFSYVAPSMFNEMKDFINSIIPKGHPLEFAKEKHIELIDHELKEMNAISEKINANYATKDNYLNAAKQNISQALWRVHDDIWRFDERILQQTI